MSLFRKFGLLMGCAAFMFLPALAADKSDVGDAKGASNDDHAAMFAEMMKYAAPGEKHRNLASLAGTWKLSSKFRHGAEAPWNESTGDSVIEWILGRRFLQQKVTSPPSEMMPVPFEGFGILGYDNLAGRYFGIWMDTFFTGAIVFHGSSDASGKVITLSGEFDDPMHGGKKTSGRWVYRIINNDKFVFEMWGPADDGKEYLHGEITYTRVK